MSSFLLSINLILVFLRVFWYTKEEFGITVYVLLEKSSKFHSNPTKFSVLKCFLFDHFYSFGG